MQHERGTDDLRNMAPTLSALAKHDPFVVEPGVFERFPHQVLASVAQQARPVRSLWLKPVAMAVPALAAVLFTWHALRPGAPSVSTAWPMDDQVYSTLADELDTYELVEAVEAGDLPAFDEVTVTLTPEEAMDYVDQHQIDLNEYLH